MIPLINNGVSDSLQIYKTIKFLLQLIKNYLILIKTNEF